MTNEQLQAIAARAEVATPGPWETRSKGQFAGDREIGCEIAGNIHPGTSTPVCQLWPGFQWYEGDKVFIAHARTDIPALLAEIAHLRARLARTAAECAYCGAVLSAADAQAQADHWRDCERHPARAELERLRNENGMLQVAVDHWAGQARLLHDTVVAQLEEIENS